MERRQRSLVGPLILITIGILFLLANMGLLPYSFWEIGFRFWPLILILVGLDIIIGRYSLVGSLVIVVLWIGLLGGAFWLTYAQGNGMLPAPAGVSDQVSQPLGEVKSATVDMTIGAARTNVSALSVDSSDLLKGTFSHAQGARVVKTYNTFGSEARLALKEEGVNFVLGGPNVSNWDIGLYPQIPLALRINGGIGRATLDLSDLNITALSVDTGVGSIEVKTPKTGVSTLRLNGGVGSAIVSIPPGVAARIRVSGGLGGLNVDTARFPKFGDTYQSADYAAAANKIDIEIDGGLGSISIR